MAITILGVQLKDRNSVEVASISTAAVRALGTAGAIAPAPSGTTTGGGSVITHGREITASNTGLAGIGVSQASLTTVGGTTYSGTTPQTITGKKFTDTVTLAGDNITLDGCMFVGWGSAHFMVRNNGNNNTVKNCLFLPGGVAGSHTAYEGIYTDSGSGLTITRCDISYCENNITTGGSAANVNITENYLHDPQNISNPTGHVDNIEVYGGSTVNIQRNRLTMWANETGVINAAPWSGSTSLSNLNVTDNYMDGGNYLVLVDLQSTGTIRFTRVLRNDMSGHQNPANHIYWALSDNDGRGTVQTEALLQASPNKILWPTTGSDVNTWVNCSDLSPNKTGQIVPPA